LLNEEGGTAVSKRSLRGPGVTFAEAAGTE